MIVVRPSSTPDRVVVGSCKYVTYLENYIWRVLFCWLILVVVNELHVYVSYAIRECSDLQLGQCMFSQLKQFWSFALRFV